MDRTPRRDPRGRDAYALGGTTLAGACGRRGLDTANESRWTRFASRTDGLPPDRLGAPREQPSTAVAVACVRRTRFRPSRPIWAFTRIARLYGPLTTSPRGRCRHEKTGGLYCPYYVKTRWYLIVNYSISFVCRECSRDFWFSSWKKKYVYNRYMVYT